MMSSAILSASGPGLIAAESAVALVFVHRKLSRVPHALAWAIAFLAFALQGALIALTGAVPPTRLTTMAMIGLNLIGMLLLLEGFHIRAAGRWSGWSKAGIAGVALIVLTALSEGRSGEIRVSSAAALLLLYSMSQVVPPERRASTAEIATLIMLGALAAVRMAQVGLALGGADPHMRGWIATAALMPSVAAGGLFILLLIASDFSGELRRMLDTDPLTGVLNRSGFEHAAQDAIERARLRAQPIAIAIADVDRFKLINDQFGHVVGDAALACVASHLAGAARRNDLVGRIGGEEFAMLLWAADEAAALSRIDPIRASLSETCVRVRPDLIVTVSLGIAERQGNEDLRPLLDRADRALYSSKRAGRDRTTLAGALA